MKKKYDVCIYTFEWETIESFDTLEEAIAFTENEFKKQKQHFAIFHGKDFITESKP